MEQFEKIPQFEKTDKKATEKKDEEKKDGKEPTKKDEKEKEGFTDALHKWNLETAERNRRMKEEIEKMKKEEK